jgi:hypothetical protein
MAPAGREEGRRGVELQEGKARLAGWAGGTCCQSRAVSGGRKEGAAGAS